MIGASLYATYPGLWACGLIRLRHRGKQPVEAAGFKDEIRWDVKARHERIRLVAPHVEQGGNLGMVLPPGTLALDVEDEKTLQAAMALDPAFQWSQEEKRRGHAIFRCPLGLRQGEIVAPGSSVRTKTRIGGLGYIVVEPSVHPSGAEYSWLRSLPARIEELPEIPAAWIEPLRTAAAAGPGTKREPRDWRELAQGAEQGGRNDALARLIGRALRDGCPEQWLLLVGEGFAARCAPPMDAAEVRKTVASIVQRHRAQAEERKAERERFLRQDPAAVARRIAGGTQPERLHLLTREEWESA